MKILHIAEAANPEWVSVPLVGWSHWLALSKITDSLLVTQIRNKEAIERYGLKEGKDFIAIDSEAVAKPLDSLSNCLRGGKGKGWTTKTAINYFSYLYFEKKLWKQLGERIKSGEFDLVHRITPLSPTQPSFIASKCKKAGIPFVLGPLNGGLPWPKEFNKERRREKEWLSYIRKIYKLLPGYHSTRKNSSKIVIASQATFSQMEDRYKHKCVYLPENGIDLSRFSETRTKQTSSPVKAVFIGRLVPYKGAHMLIKGFAEALSQNKIVLDIIGDGPDRDRLEHLVQNHQVQKNVNFTGWIDHKNLQEYIKNSDLLAFPSIREFGGGVVLESMALGVTPLIVNYGGPSELVTEDSGITVPIGDEESIVNNLQIKIGEIIDGKYNLDEMGKKAYQVVLDEYTWERKAEKMLSIYSEVLSEKEL